MTEKSQQDDFGFDPEESPKGSPVETQVAAENPGDGKGDEQGQPKRKRRRRRRSGGSPQQPPAAGGGGGRSQRGGSRSRNQRSGGSSSSSSGGGGRQPKKYVDKNAPKAEPVMSGTVRGILELHPKGYGFIRSAENDFGAQDIDPFVSSTLVEKYHLREGIMIRGEVGAGNRGQGPRLQEIESIDGRPPEDFSAIKHFDDLTPINPHAQIKLETGKRPITMRVMDLLTPIGKGQRALLVAPPRSGKTMLLQDIANSISTNHPEIHLIVLLIDERPEEVTEMRRMVNGEVIASSMDRDVESHVRISQLIVERGKRLAESGKDCVILLDSITRTARAFNKWVGNSGRTGTGGLDVRALDIPRKMFGTARLFDEGGSLTVIATALIETGSRMDDAIFQEFKGTGNMELVLSRDLADRRIWPAIDIGRSGTRREEKILSPETLDAMIQLRRALVSMNATDAMTELVRKLEMFETNAEFLERVRSVL
jgi:transcription termination factor Rho